MRTFLNGIAIPLLLAGGTFFLQGINGGILIAIGLGLLVWANRPK